MDSLQIKDTYDNRKDLLIHYLKVLYNRNRPISFSDLISDNLPSGGPEEFQSVMNELESKKFIMVTARQEGMRLHRSFSISLDGIDYLASLNIIEDKHKISKETPEPAISHNYGNIIIGDNHQSHKQDVKANDDTKTPATTNFLHNLDNQTLWAMIITLVPLLFSAGYWLGTYQEKITKVNSLPDSVFQQPTKIIQPIKASKQKP
jgi:hypothetical protein